MTKPTDSELRNWLTMPISRDALHFTWSKACFKTLHTLWSLLPWEAFSSDTETENYGWTKKTTLNCTEKTPLSHWQRDLFNLKISLNPTKSYCSTPDTSNSSDPDLLETELCRFSTNLQVKWRHSTSTPLAKESFASSSTTKTLS